MDPAAIPSMSPERASEIEESPEGSVQPATFEGLFTVLEAAIMANKQQLNNRAGPVAGGVVEAVEASAPAASGDPPAPATDQADTLITQMSAVRLDLQAALALADGQSAANKIASAVGRLDQIIDDLSDPAAGPPAGPAHLVSVPLPTPEPR